MFFFLVSFVCWVVVYFIFVFLLVRLDLFLEVLVFGKIWFENSFENYYFRVIFNFGGSLDLFKEF